MKDQTLYFPTSLDFRGRIYPTPTYLSYQSNDLARSLFLFKDISENNEAYNNLVNIIYKEGNLYKGYNNETIDKNLIENIDYVKLYMANVYGKSKLSRKGRIN